MSDSSALERCCAKEFLPLSSSDLVAYNRCQAQLVPLNRWLRAISCSCYSGLHVRVINGIDTLDLKGEIVPLQTRQAVESAPMTLVLSRSEQQLIVTRTEATWNKCATLTILSK